MALAVRPRQDTRPALGRHQGASGRSVREELTPLELGLENRLRTKVGLLSGGQRQALSLLMATFTGPQILLLDEHTAALDPQTCRPGGPADRGNRRRHQLTTLMVTHNMEQAMRLGTRLVMMHDGQIILDLDSEQKAKMTVPGPAARVREDPWREARRR